MAFSRAFLGARVLVGENVAGKAKSDSRVSGARLPSD